MSYGTTCLNLWLIAYELWLMTYSLWLLIYVYIREQLVSTWLNLWLIAHDLWLMTYEIWKNTFLVQTLTIENLSCVSNRSSENCFSLKWSTFVVQTLTIENLSHVSNRSSKVIHFCPSNFNNWESLPRFK